jgi:hypothetical protein
VFGIALLQDGVLIDWDVLTFREAWSKDKLDGILERLEILLYTYDIRHVAVKIPEVFPTASGFNQLIGGLNLLLERMSTNSHYYTLEELKKFCLPDGDTSRQAIADYLVRKHSELQSRYQSGTTPNKHHFKVFEAVCAAHLLREKVCQK